MKHNNLTGKLQDKQNISKITDIVIIWREQDHMLENLEDIIM